MANNPNGTCNGCFSGDGGWGYTGRYNGTCYWGVVCGANRNGGCDRTSQCIYYGCFSGDGGWEHTGRHHGSDYRC